MATTTKMAVWMMLMACACGGDPLDGIVGATVADPKGGQPQAEAGGSSAGSAGAGGSSASAAGKGGGEAAGGGNSAGAGGGSSAGAGGALAATGGAGGIQGGAGGASGSPGGSGGSEPSAGAGGAGGDVQSGKEACYQAAKAWCNQTIACGVKAGVFAEGESTQAAIACWGKLSPDAACPKASDPAPFEACKEAIEGGGCSAYDATKHELAAPSCASLF